MNVDSRLRLKDLLIKKEYFREHPHFDISPEFEKDVDYFYNTCAIKFPWFINLDDEKKIDLIYMCFMMGMRNLMEDEDNVMRMLSTLKESNHDRAI